MNIPIKIKVKEDGNQLEFVEKIERDGREKLKEPKYVYRYTKSNTKKGQTLSVTEAQLSAALKNDIFVEV